MSWLQTLFRVYEIRHWIPGVPNADFWELRVVDDKQYKASLKDIYHQAMERNGYLEGTKTIALFEFMKFKKRKFVYTTKPKNVIT